MKKNFGRSMLLLGLLLTAGFASMAQQAIADNLKNNKTTRMKTYLIEREIPGAGKMTPEQLKAASQTSNKVLKEMGPAIEWIQSYVLGNKLVCVYKAENEELIREHAKKGGFPANTITEVATIINPATGN
jgi:hypothetical protein